MRAKNLHHGLEFVHQPLVKIAEGKVGAQTYRPAHPDRQALLDASVQLERDHCFGDLQVKEVLARDRRIAGGFQEMNGRIPSIPLGFIEMGMLFPVTRMTDLEMLLRNIECSTRRKFMRHERTYRCGQQWQVVLPLNTSHLVHDLAQALKLFSGWILELLQPAEDHNATSGSSPGHA